MILLQQIYTIIKNRPLTFKLGLFSHFESACGFVNVKLVTVDLWAGGWGGWGGERCSIFRLSLLLCKIWIAFTLMASESYYHPIRECGILVILLLFPVGSEYNGEGQGLMQFISFNTCNSESLITLYGFIGVPPPSCCYFYGPMYFSMPFLTQRVWRGE